MHRFQVTVPEATSFKGLPITRQRGLLAVIVTYLRSFQSPEYGTPAVAKMFLYVSFHDGVPEV